MQVIFFDDATLLLYYPDVASFIDEKILTDLVTNNLARANATLTTILPKTHGNTLLVMDFDECATTQHFSRLITNHFLYRSPVPDKYKSDLSVYGLAQLFHCYVGLTKKEFDDAVTNIFKGVGWRNGFIEFAQKLNTLPQVFPVFISSGLEYACSRALDFIHATHIGVVADELIISPDGYIKGPFTVIGDKEKEYVVGQLIRRGKFTRCVSVGHGKGDIGLIRSGTPGYRLCFDNIPEVVAVSDYQLTTWPDVLPYVS